jgi:hypothetical protein
MKVWISEITLNDDGEQGERRDCASLDNTAAAIV